MNMKIDKNIVTFSLTDKEVEDASFLSMDDADLGKMVKSTALMLREPHKDDAVAMQAIAVLLANLANRSNAGELTLDLKGVTYKDEPAGDYKVTVQKV